MSELRKRHVKLAAAWAISAAAMIATLLVCMGVGSRSYILGSALFVLFSMLPFFAGFEGRRPQARELVLLSVMIVLAVVSRVVFAPIPSFKPMAAIVMIAGIAFGPSSGFLVGSLSALVSNFIFGQGPWTLFQMLSMGLCGLVFGALSKAGIVKCGGWSWKEGLVIGFAGGFFILVVAGPILDTSSLFWLLGDVTPAGALAIYGAGVPVNAVHGLATSVTLILIGDPILSKISRVKTKYQLME